MSETPTYEIGHFECDTQRLKDGRVVKYVVAEVVQGVHYVLHCNTRYNSHYGIMEIVNDTLPQYQNAKILGGGRMKLLFQGEGKFGLRLHGYSEDYGEETKEIRQAFTPIVAEKLRELGLDIVAKD